MTAREWMAYLSRYEMEVIGTAYLVGSLLLVVACAVVSHFWGAAAARNVLFVVGLCVFVPVLLYLLVGAVRELLQADARQVAKTIVGVVIVLSGPCIAFLAVPRWLGPWRESLWALLACIVSLYAPGLLVAFMVERSRRVRAAKIDAGRGPRLPAPEADHNKDDSSRTSG